MEPVDIVLTKDTFEVLASETRLDILKILSTRRMTVTELADTLDLAKSTVHHHLQRLADAGLVAADDDGRAWVYYALTQEGQGLLQPRRHPDQGHSWLQDWQASSGGSVPSWPS